MTSYRVNQEEVQEIIDTDVDNLLPFIMVADTLVTKKLTGQSLGDDLLKEITRWLAAHFVAVRDPIVRQEKTGDASATFFLGKEGTGLNATPYGQQAMMIDTSGTLASLGKKQASIEAIA